MNSEPPIETNAVSVFGSTDGMDEFPVLKAFQQYIDAEQAKARKRLLTMGVFFSVLVIIIISVFSVLLLNSSSRNQQLNDRLVEYALKDRDTKVASEIRSQQDSAAIAAITKRLEEVQSALAESKAANEKLLESSKLPSAAELEVEHLKAVLQKERELIAQEKERERLAKEKEERREAELEAYRRKHYPEFYRKKLTPAKEPIVTESDDIEIDDDDVKDILDDLNDDDAIEYFSEETPKRSTTRAKTEKKSTKKKTTGYSIPVEIKSSSGSWRIPEE